jgi:hypothetical protein
MDTPTVVLSIFSSNQMDTPQTADSSIFKAPADVHRFSLARNDGIVTCRDCGASLAPFWALRMLADQYALALAQIDRLQDRVSNADARILELSAELDALAESERARKASSVGP